MRKAFVERKTDETEVRVELNLDGKGKYEVNTPYKFFNHLLELFAKNAMIDLKLQASGDLEYHIVEDTGIVLGEALQKALGNKKGIARYGFFILPMDESLALNAIDLSGRGKLVFDAEFGLKRIEGLSSEVIEEFLESVALNAKITLQFRLLRGNNEHHKAEALFKCFGRALRMAVALDGKERKIPSTKGLL